MKKKYFGIIGILSCLAIVGTITVSANDTIGDSNKNSSITTTETNIEETHKEEVTTNSVFIDDLSKQLFYDEYTYSNLEVGNNDTQLSKDEIYNMMLNSIDYYDKVSGTCVVAYGNTDYSICTEFNSDLIKGIFEEKVYNIDRDSLNTENMSLDMSNAKLDYTNYGSFNSFDENIINAFNINTNKINSVEIDNSNNSISCDKTYVSAKVNATKITGDRSYIDKDGYKNYVYRENPTNIHSAELNLFPQYLAFGYLEDFNNWNVISTDEYLGRYCTVIQGGYTEYGKKFNVDNFKMYIDNSTGVVLKYEGYCGDNLVDYSILTDLSYISDISIENISSEVQYYASQSQYDLR